VAAPLLEALLQGPVKLVLTAPVTPRRVNVPSNFSQQPSSGRTVARRFRALFFLRVALGYAGL